MISADCCYVQLIWSPGIPDRVNAEKQRCNSSAQRHSATEGGDESWPRLLCLLSHSSEESPSLFSLLNLTKGNA